MSARANGRTTTATTKPSRAKNNPKAPATSYCAGVYPGKGRPLPPKLTSALTRLRDNLGLPIWLLLQGGESDKFSVIDYQLTHAIRHHVSKLPKEGHVALVINSPGGQARSAYELARLMCRRCDGFVAVIADEAMSAATLLALGADEIIMNSDASLGPLDAQVWDEDAERYVSALNEVQALERLRAYAIESIDVTMALLTRRTGKRVEVLLPHVLRFVADSMRPLMEKIDVVHYNERARILKVAEEYGVRLLARHTGLDARQLASNLVESYPEHEFPIDRDEARELGLRIAEITPEQEAILHDLWFAVQGITAIGPVEAVT